MAFSPEKPCNNLPPLPPKRDVESKVVLKKAASAGRALAELKGLGSSIPDQSILVNSIVLQEAKASSAIENIVTTNDVLYRAFSTANGADDPATKEVLRYREAVWYGVNILAKRPVLSTNLFISIAQTIKENDAGIRRVPGTTVASARTGKPIYTPPGGEERIRMMLKNLEDFLHADDGIDPLVRLAIAHYQFEAIHPFHDGNGRTGRIINILYLLHRGLLDAPVLYLSRAIIERKTDYYKNLLGVTQTGAWEPWIVYMLDAVERTAMSAKEMIIAIRALMARTMDAARKKLPPHVYSKELIETIFRQPYSKVQFLVEAGIAERKTAATYLRELERAGFVKSHKVGREVLFLNKALVDVLGK